MRDKTRTIEEAAKRVRDASKQIARCLFGGPLITHAVVVSDESTDCATGHCECELCGKAIDPWDHYCRHCGAEVVGE